MGAVQFALGVISRDSRVSVRALGAEAVAGSSFRAPDPQVVAQSAVFSINVFASVSFFPRAGRRGVSLQNKLRDSTSTPQTSPQRHGAAPGRRAW